MRVGHLLATIVASVSLFAALKTSAQTTAPIRDKQRLPSDVLPETYAWFWLENLEFQPAGYRTFVDLIASRSDFGLLTSSLRSPRRELTLPATHDQIKEGVEYARTKGIRVAMDLDVRLARMAFRKKYPNELQWQIRLRRSDCSPNGPTIINIEPIHLSDHMTYPGAEYEILTGKLFDVLLVDKAHDSQSRSSLIHLTATNLQEESANRVSVAIQPAACPAGHTVVVQAGFEYNTPDVFAPHLEAFQHSIYDQYRDVPLAGALKDEWGFPPTREEGAKHGNFWYSNAFDAAYRRAGGRELLRDLVLMATGLGGTREQRLAAVNRYMQLTLSRNVEIENDFYDSVKRVFGTNAFTGTHATWGNMPAGDAFKNGYSWWGAKRDIGQTDEFWPLPIRTALAKKMGSSVWYNQFYARDTAAYAHELWQDAQAGGRVNFHPLFPSSMTMADHVRLLSSAVMKGEKRVRLLNFIATTPLDCPVAIVFGHAAALNWLGPHFGDLGVDFAAALWRAGLPADVIPSSEIISGALHAGDDGLVHYVRQRYRALVFLNPEFEPDSTFVFLQKTARSNTSVFVRGAAVHMPDGSIRPPNTAAIDGARMDATPSQVLEALESWSGAPRTNIGVSRLIDGTCLVASGKTDPTGDILKLDFRCGEVPVKAIGQGVFAVRFTSKGELLAIAASGLQSMTAGGLSFSLQTPVDFALWRTDTKSGFHGVFQGVAPVPKALQALCQHWIFQGSAN
jgi:hypothetical protein